MDSAGGVDDEMECVEALEDPESDIRPFGLQPHRGEGSSSSKRKTRTKGTEEKRKGRQPELKQGRR